MTVGVLIGVADGVADGVLVDVAVGVLVGVLVVVAVAVGVGSVHETVLALCSTNSHSEVPRARLELSPQRILSTLPWSLALKYVEPVSVKTPS